MFDIDSATDRLNVIVGEIRKIDLNLAALQKEFERALERSYGFWSAEIEAIQQKMKPPVIDRETLINEKNRLEIRLLRARAESLPKNPSTIPTADRKATVKAYCQFHRASKASVYRKAAVDRSEYYKWERGELPAGSSVDIRIQRTLSE